MFNVSVTQAVFPCMLKRAEVVPLFKKGDATSKVNYRPISILPCLSKIVEGILIDQLRNYIEPLMSNKMSGFRKGFSCQTVLMDFIETC